MMNNHTVDEPRTFEKKNVTYHTLKVVTDIFTAKYHEQSARIKTAQDSCDVLLSIVEELEKRVSAQAAEIAVLRREQG